MKRKNIIWFIVDQMSGHVYGFKEIAVSPLYKSHKIEGSSIRVSFDYAESGLMMAEKAGFLPPVPVEEKPGWLSIQAEDDTWHWADVEIDGAELIVSSQ